MQGARARWGPGGVHPRALLLRFFLRRQEGQRLENRQDSLLSSQKNYQDEKNLELLTLLKAPKQNGLISSICLSYSINANLYFQIAN